MESTQDAKKRPVWVWIISIFFFLSSVWTLFAFYLVYSGTIPLQPAQLTYFKSLTLVDHSLTVLLLLSNLGGAVALLLLRSPALYFFVGAFILNVVMTIWHILTKGWIAAVGGAGFLGMLIAYGLIVAVCIYTWNLKKSGLLT